MSIFILSPTFSLFVFFSFCYTRSIIGDILCSVFPHESLLGVGLRVSDSSLVTFHWMKAEFSSFAPWINEM
jgi:hypothetical protein